MTTYQGSCGCKRVRFEVDLDLSKGTIRCNCTICFKRRWWGAPAKPDKFRAISGESELTKFRPASGPGGFCKHCGVAVYSYIDKAEWNDGEYVSINLCALDGLDAATLAAIPITYLDGLHDTWQPITEHTSYL